MTSTPNRIREMVADLAGGDVLSLARAVSLVEAGGPPAQELLAACRALNRRALRIGAAGAPVSKTVAGMGEGVEQRMAEIAKRGQREISQLPGGLAGLAIDHLGIAVRSIPKARRFYELLGLQIAAEEIVAHEQVKTAMLPVGSSRFELLEPTAEDSTIGCFLAKRGEGLHHVALRVSGLDDLVARLQKEGVRLAGDRVKIGAGGHRYIFVHPHSTGGVLLELVEEVTA